MLQISDINCQQNKTILYMKVIQMSRNILILLYTWFTIILEQEILDKSDYTEDIFTHHIFQHLGS